MRSTTVGLLTGMALGFAAFFGGFGAFVVVAVVGLAGMAVGYLVRRGGPAADYLREREDGLRRGANRRSTTSRGSYPSGGGADRRARVR